MGISPVTPYQRPKSTQHRAPQMLGSHAAPALAASHAGCVLADKLVMTPKKQAVYIQLFLLLHMLSFGVCYKLGTAECRGHTDEGHDVN